MSQNNGVVRQEGKNPGFKVSDAIVLLNLVYFQNRERYKKLLLTNIVGPETLRKVVLDKFPLSPKITKLQGTSHKHSKLQVIRKR